MHSLKVVVLLFAVNVTIAMANNKKYAKCPKNSPHKAPCMLKNNAGTGECRSNGECTNNKCTKWCKEIEPTTTLGLSSTPTPAETTTLGLSSTPTPAESTTTPFVTCSPDDIQVTSGQLVFDDSLFPDIIVGQTKSISCVSGNLVVFFTCDPNGMPVFDYADCSG